MREGKSGDVMRMDVMRGDATESEIRMASSGRMTGSGNDCRRGSRSRILTGVVVAEGGCDEKEM